MSASKSRPVSPEPRPDIISSADIPIATAATIRANKGELDFHLHCLYVYLVNVAKVLFSF